MSRRRVFLVTVQEDAVDDAKAQVRIIREALINRFTPASLSAKVTVEPWNDRDKWKNV